MPAYEIKIDLMMAIEPLLNDRARAKYIYDIARNDNVLLSSEDFHQWIKEFVATTKDGLMTTFCENIREFWGEKASLFPGFQNLVLGIVLNLSDCLIAERKEGLKLHDGVLAMFFRHSIYFCQMLQGAENIGAAQKHLRLFGEMANIDLFVEIEKRFPDMPKAFNRAIAEGVIKRIGADQVLKIYSATTRRIKPIGNIYKQIEELQSKLASLCNFNTSDNYILEERGACMVALRELMGPDEAACWFANEFPNLVGDQSDAICTGDDCPATVADYATYM